MKVGTKSVIGGAHCFLLHPFFVAWGWKRLFGFPWDPHLWFAFALHDIGYIGRGDMDGPEGEEHVVLGARIMGSLFGPVWEDECLRHSRYWSRRMGLPISRLCLADKMAFALTPAWLYLPMTRWTGELREYMTRSRQRQADDNSFTGEEERLVRSEVADEWLRGLQSYTLRWVERHRDQYITRRVAAPGALAASFCLGSGCQNNLASGPCQFERGMPADAAIRSGHHCQSALQ